ncbi:DBH-like monooxygenase protein 1-like protein [Caerostris extrusa]|uniref:DBH-like monooxygenase protein 1-like protein n=1 Tax=Caerostris extrusa TaxID=172846 RepID=A0AAV4VFJ8_CAEEX|nr:DBH-like monooxygenase protein 1-like protein [Caerostris extrusa]
MTPFGLSHKKKNKLPDDVRIWNIRLPNITIPDDTDTTYWCKIVKAPPLNKKHHVIQVEPLISEKSLRYVHHMVLYRCLGATARELEPHVHHTGQPCYAPDTPHTSKCESIYAAWGNRWIGFGNAGTSWTATWRQAKSLFLIRSSL